MEFNASKSIYTNFGTSAVEKDIVMGEKPIPFSENFLYLGMPIGNRGFKENFIEDGFRRVEKCFYSLYGLGCKAGLLNPYTIGYIYKQYCQSVFKYGLELCFLSNKTQKELNKRQNILIRRAIGLGQYTKMKPILKCLNVESIEQIYALHKFYFLKQVKKNELSSKLFNFLEDYYNKSRKPVNDSFHKQLTIAFSLSNSQADVIVNDAKEAIVKIKSIYNVEPGLTDSINYIIASLDREGRINQNLDILNMLLRYS
jgi:hypothetical protein